MKYVITYPLAYSLGIGYIISYLRLNGHEVKLIIEPMECPDIDGVIAQIKEYNLNLPRRSVDGCIKELKGLKAIGSKRFFMADDSFTIDKSWLREFLPR